MHASDFRFPLPVELIAQYPHENRGDSRLLVVEGGAALQDRRFGELGEFLNPGDSPEALFCVEADAITAREYCNLHGHWKS